jgi:hypothetical protein
LTFAPGETVKTLTLQLLDNPDAVEDRTIQLQLSNPSFGVLLGESRTVTIVQAGGGGCSFSPAASQTPLAGVGLISACLFLLFLRLRKMWRVRTIATVNLRISKADGLSQTPSP